MTEAQHLRCLFCGGPLTATLAQEGHGYMARDVPGGIECDGCAAEWGPDGSFVSEPSGALWQYRERTT